MKYPDTYDSQGNPSTGRTYTYGHDGMGRLATLVDNRPGDPPGWTWVSAATYNAAGQLTYMTGWNGLSETRQYNERLQLTQIQQNGPTLQYFYPDAQNNDGRITRQLVNGVEKAYTYDSLGRLATAGSSSYTYDGFGNRLQQTSPAVYLTYNASNNRITTTGYSYDNNGNLTAMPNLTMSYDVENRLAEAQTQNGTERYRYAPSGQRVWKQKPLGPMEWYFYGVDGRLIGTYVTCQYYWTLFQEQSTNVYFGGRTLQAQGQTGMKQDRLGTTSYSPTNYTPYGENVNWGDDGLGFTGYYQDSTTGLDYAQQRYYAPSIGRFTSADPYMPSAAIARPQSWNRYAYVENDPVNMVDPDGALPIRLDPGPGGTVDPRSGYIPNAAFFLASWWRDYPPPADQSGFDPRDYYGPRAEERQRALDMLPAALATALIALSKPDCRGLFNTQGSATPEGVLLSMAMGNSSYGSIRFLNSMSSGGVAQATYEGQVYKKKDKEWVWTRSSIEISTQDSSGYWLQVDLRGQADTLIHELGHVFNIIEGLGGSQIEYDADRETGKADKAAQARNQARVDKCFKD